MNGIYVVVYSDYDECYKILGYSTDEKIASKCAFYDKKRVNRDDYGRRWDIVPVKCLDDEDFDVKIRELEEKAKQEELARLEAIKEKELAEYNRIKEKYGL